MPKVKANRLTMNYDQQGSGNPLGIRGSEVVVFEECSQTPTYERVEEFNQKTLAFLRRHAA
jgi:hypothetical protein